MVFQYFLPAMFVLLFGPAFAQQGTIKVYDGILSRAQCPDGHEPVGRFVEAPPLGTKGKIKGGMECTKAKGAPKAPPQARRAPPIDPNASRIEVLEEEGKKTECPKGYVQTGSFSNFAFAGGKMSKRAGIYCTKEAPTESDGRQL